MLQSRAREIGQRSRGMQRYHDFEIGLDLNEILWENLTSAEDGQYMMTWIYITSAWHVSRSARVPEGEERRGPTL